MVFLAALAAAASAALSPFPGMGGGNVVPRGDATSNQSLQTLNQIGAGGFRCNLYPNVRLVARPRAAGLDTAATPSTEFAWLAASRSQDYLHHGNWSVPSPEVLGPILDNALAAGLQNRPFLFELYATFAKTGPLGSYDQWFAIGAAFAAYGMPGGTWAKSRPDAPAGAGIDLYTVANEPDGTDFCPGKVPGPGPYLAAVSGLSAGVRSVCAACRVSPGGFKSPNAFNDMTLTGLGPLLAPLYNNGTLDAIDLHTYVDEQYAPMNGTFSRSAQADFGGVRSKNNITADVRFSATEFNYKLRNVTEEQAAAGFLTAFLDNAGVVSDSGAPRSLLAFPWNIFHTHAGDGDYGLARSYGPGGRWVPGMRGTALWMALNLTAGLRWESADPRHSGRFVLSDADAAPGGEASRRVWAWQNRRFWSDVAGSAWTLRGVPGGATTVGVFSWSGLAGTVQVGSDGTASVPQSMVPKGGTYFACARAAPSDDGCVGLAPGL